MKSLLLSLTFVLAATALQAQDFSTAVGLRLGFPVSASVKHFLDDENAIEGFVGFRGNSSYRLINVSGAYQRHYDLGLSNELSPMRWYWGAGASFYSISYRFNNIFRDNDFSTVGFGLNGYLGLQYPLQSVPLELTLDWIPTIIIGSGFGGGLGGFRGGYGGIGVRYMLGQ